MDAQILLCDFAQVANGKLTMVGAGWTHTNMPTPTAVGVLIHIPWNDATKPHIANLALKDDNGHPVTDPAGNPIEAMFPVPPVGHPPGVAPGSSIPYPIAMNCGPLPLGAGSRYVWELSIDSQQKAEWQVPFQTLSPPVKFQTP